MKKSKVLIPAEERSIYPHANSGMSIRDAKKPLQFTVVPRDVVCSRVRDQEACAAARALKRETGAIRAWVKRTITVLQFSDGRVVRYRNPGALTRAIEKFDATAGVFPEGTYELQVVSHSQSVEEQKKKNAKRDYSNRPTGAIMSRSRPILALR